MSDRAKIISIYVIVAILSTAVLATSFWLRGVRKERFNRPAFENVGGEKARDFGNLENDFTLTNQDGEEVKISDLKGKVWVASNFFASCKYCLDTASSDLKQLYDEFGANPDFHIVSISINPEDDTEEQLKVYANHMGAKTDSWWFLRNDEEEAVHDYIEKEMKFMEVIRNPPEAKDLYSHDRGLMVLNGWKIVNKKDLQYAQTQGDNVRKKVYQDVRASILESLAALRENKEATETP